MKKRISIVIGDFHKDLAEEMIEFAKDEMKNVGIEPASIVRVAGSYEVPLVVDTLLAQPKMEAVIVLGYIEKGETMHGEVMGQVVHTALVKLQLKYNKPVGMGIIGPGATPTQAQVRKEGAARGAVKAVLRSLATLEELSA